jgi:hypothetical protein
MEAMAPWLLLIIAALIVACVSFYYQIKQVESQARGEQSVIADELRDAEEALLSALDKIQRMDRVLSARERALTPPPADSASLETQNLPVPESEREEPPAGRIARREVRAPAATSNCQTRATALAREGLAPAEIARELELPVGEVELALALSQSG